MSAGSHPTGQAHPRSLTLLAREGISTGGYFSKSWDNLPHTPDVVVTVCASAAGETCPECAATRYASIKRGDKHLGRSKAGEKSLLSWAGSDWQIPREVDEVP